MLRYNACQFPKACIDVRRPVRPVCIPIRLRRVMQPEFLVLLRPSHPAGANNVSQQPEGSVFPADGSAFLSGKPQSFESILAASTCDPCCLTATAVVPAEALTSFSTDSQLAKPTGTHAFRTVAWAYRIRRRNQGSKSGSERCNRRRYSRRTAAGTLPAAIPVAASGRRAPLASRFSANDRPMVRNAGCRRQLPGRRTVRAPKFN